MGWIDVEKIVQSAAAGGSGGAYFRLKDGERAVVVFKGDPIVRRLHWDGQRTVDCAGGNDACAFCADGERIILKVAIAIGQMNEDDEWERVVWEASRRAFESVVAIREKFPLDEWSFEVRRSGTGTSTNYNVMPEDRLTDADNRVFAEMFSDISPEEEKPAPKKKAAKKKAVVEEEVDEAPEPEEFDRQGIMRQCVAASKAVGYESGSMGEILTSRYKKSYSADLTEDELTDLLSWLTDQSEPDEEIVANVSEQDNVPF